MHKTFYNISGEGASALPLAHACGHPCCQHLQFKNRSGLTTMTENLEQSGDVTAGEDTWKDRGEGDGQGRKWRTGRGKEGEGKRGDGDKRREDSAIPYTTFQVYQNLLISLPREDLRETAPQRIFSCFCISIGLFSMRAAEFRKCCS